MDDQQNQSNGQGANSVDDYYAQLTIESNVLSARSTALSLAIEEQKLFHNPGGVVARAQQFARFLVTGKTDSESAS